MTLMYVIDSSDAGWCGDLSDADPAALMLVLVPAKSAECAPEVAESRPREDAAEGANPLFSSRLAVDPSTRR